MNFNTDFTYLIMYPIKTALIKGLLRISKDLGNAKLLSAVSLDNLDYAGSLVGRTGRNQAEWNRLDVVTATPSRPRWSTGIDRRTSNSSQPVRRSVIVKAASD